MRVLVAGVGLVGGSVALAARGRLGAEVLGTDTDPAALDAACAAGVLDGAAGSLQEGAAEADIIVVATPVPALEPTVRAACAAAPDTAVITDVGSTKRALVDAIDDPRFIGGHPLAGAEAAGVEHAREDLFDGARWYLTPRADARGTGYERLHRFVSALGAQPLAASADEHDRAMAAVSHLPHVFANVLAGQAATALDGESLPPTGPSFRDATRVAGANPSLWAGIYSANSEALIEQVDGAIRRLHEVREQLASGADLGAWQAAAREDRRALLEAGAIGGASHELRVAVPNRPGVVAELALTLGRAGINISDMSLSPAPDQRSGVVALWIAEADAGRARDLITERGLPVT